METTTVLQSKSDELPDLMDVDCDVIDRELLPPSVFRCAKVASGSDVAPPQGHPFLDKVSSTYLLLRKEPFIYR